MNMLKNSLVVSVLAVIAILAPLASTFAQSSTMSKKHPIAMVRKRITADQAKQIALSKVKGKVTKKPELEKEDGKLQWEVIVVNGKTMTEVNVDATTGKITSIEKVTAKEEAAEKAKEHKKKG